MTSSVSPAIVHDGLDARDTVGCLDSSFEMSMISCSPWTLTIRQTSLEVVSKM